VFEEHAAEDRPDSAACGERRDPDPDGDGSLLLILEHREDQ